LPERLLREAPQGNHQQPKILTLLVSSLSLPKRGVCTVFLSASAQSTLLLFFFSVTLFAKGKKDVCTPTATTVLHLRQKKQPEAIIHNM